MRAWQAAPYTLVSDSLLRVPNVAAALQHSRAHPALPPPQPSPQPVPQATPRNPYLQHMASAKPSRSSQANGGVSNLNTMAAAQQQGGWPNPLLRPSVQQILMQQAALHNTTLQPRQPQPGSQLLRPGAGTDETQSIHQASNRSTLLN